MWREVFSKKRVGILLLLLFAGTSTTLVVAHQCHTPSESVAISQGSSHSLVDGQQHTHGAINNVHNVVIQTPKVLDSVAGELCVGLFLLVLLVGRRYQLRPSARRGLPGKPLENRFIKVQILHQNLAALSLPQLGLLRI
jgi:hypothetical protein